MIYGNFTPANELEGATEIGSVTKAFCRKISPRKRPAPTIWSTLDSPFCGIYPVYTRLLLAHRLDYFNSKPEHAYSSLTSVKWGCLLSHLISLPSPSSGVILYCWCIAQIYLFVFFPIYSFIAGETFQKQNISRVASYAVQSVSFSSP